MTVPPDAGLLEPHSAELAAASAHVLELLAGGYNRARLERAQAALAEALQSASAVAMASIDTELAELKDSIQAELQRIAPQLDRVQDLVNLKTWLAARGARSFAPRPLTARSGMIASSLQSLVRMLMDRLNAIETSAAKPKTRSRSRAT